MTQKNRTLEGKNRTLGGRGGQKSSKIVGHHLCTFPYTISSRIRYSLGLGFAMANI